MFATADRRTFLRTLAAAGAGGLVEGLFARFANADVWPDATSPYGPLEAMVPIGGTVPLLALPRGFSYRLLSEAGRPMSDGVPTPKSPDGMAAFEGGGFIRLVRNHELLNPGKSLAAPLDSYDPRGSGGVTTLIIDPATRAVVRDFVSMSGTVGNCLGGATPWNTWITSEESVGGKAQGFEREHGYCFEIDPAAERPSAPNPIVGMGRFLHEAVITDPTTGIAYMTEDEGACGFYRYVPERPGRFQAGGVLQILAVCGVPFYDTARNQKEGTRLSVGWITIDEPNPATVAPGTQPVYDQGRLAGAAKFRRLEGAAFHGRSIYFAATNGGDQRLGQIWKYTPDRNVAPVTRRRRVGGPRATPPREGELTLVYQSTDAAKLKLPDNLCFSRRGSLIMAEDYGSGAQSVRCLSPAGELFELARNIAPGNEHSELAGVTFSPDGQTLFVNIYFGYTLAIWGPWHLGPV